MSSLDKERKSAEEGNVVSQFIYATRFYKGDQTAQDYATAFKWYLRAAEQGLPRAQFMVAIFYLQGQGTQQDNNLGISWLEKAMSLGKTEALKLWTECYFKGTYVPHSFDDLVVMAQSGIEITDPHDQFVLGMHYVGMFYSSPPADTSNNLAVEWFLKASHQGYSPAQYFLSTIYLDSKRGFQDIKKAIYWLNESAARGYAGAQHDLGFCFEDGKHVPKNIPEAINWYQKAASQGHPASLYNLGCFYLNGKEVKRDYAKALKCFHKAMLDLPQAEKAYVTLYNNYPVFGNLFA